MAKSDNIYMDLETAPIPDELREKLLIHQEAAKEALIAARTLVKEHARKLRVNGQMPADRDLSITYRRFGQGAMSLVIETLAKEHNTNLPFSLK